MDEEMDFIARGLPGFDAPTTYQLHPSVAGVVERDTSRHALEFFLRLQQGRQRGSLAEGKVGGRAAWLRAQRTAGVWSWLVGCGNRSRRLSR